MNEQVLRVIAAAAAVGIFAYPFVSPAAARISAMFAKSSDPVREKMRDIEIVLALSARLAGRGLKDGVDLCQKLIDVILKPQK